MNDHAMIGWLRRACILAVLTALTASCRQPPMSDPPPPPGPGEVPPPPPLPPPDPETVPTPNPKPEPKQVGCPIRAPGDKTIDCPIYSCGNSAKLYGADVEALDTSGKQAQQRLRAPFRLVRGSLTHAGGECQGVSGLSLEVRGGGFVGVTGGLPSGAPVVVRCAGEDLEGARFQLERTVPRHTVIVEIADANKVATWEKDTREYVPTYDLVVHKESPSRGQPAPRVEHLCPGSKKEPDTHALLIQGETYKPDGTVAETGPSWFNIGCAGSGISKMRLLGFDPMNGKSTVEERQATLKMLTGKYCDAWSRTRDGTPIYLVRQGTRRGASGSIRPEDGWAPERVGSIESRWGAGGALCVSHLRLWSPHDECSQLREEEWVEHIQRTCGIPACDETVPCSSENAKADGAAVWRTCTIDHVLHPSR